MVNNYDAVIRSLSDFILANAPAGGEHELARIRLSLEQGRPQDYIGIEFRPTENTGCTLYVRVVSPDGSWCSSLQTDAEGNEWSSYKVACEVSWASWGSADLSTTQQRLAVMTNVARFACEVERAFPDVFHRMDATAAEVAERQARFAKDRAARELTELVKAHAKGMKVGQERIVPLFGFDFRGVCPLTVERAEAGRSFKYRATATSTDGFAFTREA
jgi:hypothetical protein